MKTAIIIISSALAIAAIVAIVMYQKRKTATNQALINNSMLAAQSQANAECQKNWLCVATSLLGGVGNTVAAFKS